MSKRPLNDAELKMLKNIDTHGWHAMHVFDPNGKSPPFTYSVGFTQSLAAPEFIVFGLPRELMHSMIWEAYRQTKAGKTIEDGAVWDDLIEGHKCVSRRADHAALFRDYTTSADWFWRHQGHADHPPIMQLVWPGAEDGLFPWDDGCAQKVIDSQLQLWS